VQISRFRFFMGEPRSQWCNDGQFEVDYATWKQFGIVRYLQEGCSAQEANMA
jgi:hypothetical protein